MTPPDLAFLPQWFEALPEQEMWIIYLFQEEGLLPRGKARLGKREHKKSPLTKIWRGGLQTGFAES